MFQQCEPEILTSVHLSGVRDRVSGLSMRSPKIKTRILSRVPQMTVSSNYAHISPEDYLEGKNISLIKHEYIRGEVYAMVGASKAHGIIALNLATQLKSHLPGSGYIPYMADMKVQMEAANIYYYPDVVVTCDERDNSSSDEDFICYPCLSDRTDNHSPRLKPLSEYCQS
jgi:hypothetical protein